jgi:hypothetical protein
MVDWLKLPDPWVFVQPLSHGYYPPGIAQEIAGVLRDVIGEILGGVSVKITAPIATVVPSSLDRPPYIYLVRNLSTNNVAKLVKQRCWSTTRIGFLVYIAETIIPSYMGAIQGFNMSDDEDVSNVRNLVLWTYRDFKVLTIIDETVSSCPTVSSFAPIISADEILYSLKISMIHIRSQGGTLRPIANLYL